MNINVMIKNKINILLPLKKNPQIIRKSAYLGILLVLVF